MFMPSFNILIGYFNFYPNLVAVPTVLIVINSWQSFHKATRKEKEVQTKNWAQPWEFNSGPLAQKTAPQTRQGAS